MTGMHAKVGFGIKLVKPWYLVPYVEVPLVTFYEWNNAKPTLQYFSSEWMPIIVGVKLAYFFKQDPNKCADGDDRGRKQAEKYQNNR